jgi:hypothetical protein
MFVIPFKRVWSLGRGFGNRGIKIFTDGLRDSAKALRGIEGEDPRSIDRPRRQGQSPEKTTTARSAAVHPPKQDRLGYVVDFTALDEFKRVHARILNRLLGRRRIGARPALCG